MHVSFRNRLTFFFILLVILPVLAVAFVGILIVRDSEEGKTDAGLAQAQVAAEGLYRELRDRSQKVVETVSKDEELAIAVRDGDRAALQNRLEDLAQRGGAVRVRLTLEGQEPIDAGGGEAVAPEVRQIVDADGNVAGEISLSVSTAEEYADLLARVTGLEVLLTQGGRLVDGTIETESARGLPLRGEADVDGRGLSRHGLPDARLRRRHAARPRAGAQGRARRRRLGQRRLHRPHPARVPRLRAGLRAHRRALAAVADRPPADGRAQHRQGRLLDRGADRGQRRVRRAGQGVQLDGAPARDAARGAPARARAAPGDRAARRRVARQGPGSRRAAGDRRADGGRRRRRRVRPGRHAPRRQRHAVGGRARRQRLLLHGGRAGRRGGGAGGRRGGRDADLRAPTRSRAR